MSYFFLDTCEIFAGSVVGRAVRLDLGTQAGQLPNFPSLASNHRNCAKRWLMLRLPGTSGAARCNRLLGCSHVGKAGIREHPELIGSEGTSVPFPLPAFRTRWSSRSVALAIAPLSALEEVDDIHNLCPPRSLSGPGTLYVVYWCPVRVYG